MKAMRIISLIFMYFSATVYLFYTNITDSVSFISGMLCLGGSIVTLITLHKLKGEK